MALVDDVRSVMNPFGIPEHVWLPIMSLESEGNPQARNLTMAEDSRGLFQINVRANPQYAGMDLYNPVINARIAAVDFILPAYRQVAGISNPGEQASYVWREGIRPEWTVEKDWKIRSLASAITAPIPSTAPAGGGAVVHPWVKPWMPQIMQDYLNWLYRRQIDTYNQVPNVPGTRFNPETKKVESDPGYKPYYEKAADALKGLMPDWTYAAAIGVVLFVAIIALIVALKGD